MEWWGYRFGRKPDLPKTARGLHIFASVLLVLASPGIVQPSNAGQGFVTTGIGGGPDVLDSYQGIIYAPLSDLSQSGPVIRVWNKAYRFSYKTDLPRANDVKISALGLSVEAELGWQLASKAGRIALYGGLVWRDHMLTPRHPGSNLNKSRLGFSLTLDAEYKFSDQFGIMGNANYIQGFNQYWSQLRPYYSTNFYNGHGHYKIGFDIAGFGGKNYQITRLGIFASDYQIKLWNDKRMFIGGQAGAQFSIKDKQFSPYAGINIGFLFDN